MLKCLGYLSLGVVFCVQAMYCLTADELSRFSSDVQFTVSTSGDKYEFFSPGYPDHATTRVNPNTASVQNFTYEITINPDNEGDSVYCTNLGPVGFAKNGVAIYNALTGQNTDAVLYEDFDDCKGHSSPDGSYHYHQFPTCVGSETEVDQFIGIAIDGNPIYGPKASDFDDLIKSTDLDACHGRFKDGKYRYHITSDFPYIIGCYKAEPAVTLSSGLPPGNGGEGGGGGGGGGMGPQMGRRKRQTEEATCENTDYGAELCDCTLGTLSHCSTLRDDHEDACGDNSAPSQSLSLQLSISILLSAVLYK